MRFARRLSPFGPLLLACGVEAPPDPPGFAFAVFGDAPYTASEVRLVEMLIDEVNRDDLAFFIHVGDILEFPCSDSLFLLRFQALQRIRHPVIYTPGDNEWTDCWRRRSGEYPPLERLARLRGVFFPNPVQSSGGRHMELASQSRDLAHAEFLENARWTFQHVVFATIHMVGSSNGMRDFANRTVAEDREVVRRTAAAVSWLRDTFAEARAIEAKAVVLATHADPRFDLPPERRQAFDTFLRAFEEEAAAFGGPVLFVHGDTHRQRMDKPLSRRATRQHLGNVTRLETYGSPVVGWMRVVVDTSAADPFLFQARRVGR